MQLSLRNKIILLIGVLILIGIAFGVWRQKKKHVHDLPTIIDTNRLTVVIDSSSVGFSKDGNTVSGFQYEIVKTFADSLGVELVVSQNNDFQSCVDGLQKGDFDIIASFIPPTMALQDNVIYSMPFFSSKQVLVQACNSDSANKDLITKHAQLAKCTIHIPSHSPYKMRIQHLSDEIADTIIINELNNKSAEQLVRAVSKGEIKYTICDELLAKKLKLKYTNIDVNLAIGFSHQMCWGVHPKSPLLLEKLNAFLDEFIGSSEYWKLYRKYYGL